MSSIYHTFFFDPLYNSLIFLFQIFPWADAGIVVVMLTILVRLILYPLSRKAVLTQMRMAEIAPELNAIKEKYKSNSEEQARRTLTLYREKGVNPFSGILVIIIQIPIILALYQIFINLPEINGNLLYSFIKAPEIIRTSFLGFIDVGGKSALLAVLAGVSTYFQIKVSTQGQGVPKGNSFGDNLAKSMQTQMKYVFPAIMLLIAYQVSGAIALYFLTTNLFSIGQELFIKRKRPHTTLS